MSWLKNISGKYSLLLCFIFLYSASKVGYKIGRWKSNTILNWDISGYHLYLPALLIHKDIKEYKFYEKIDKEYKPSLETKYYGIDKHPTTKYRVNKYSCGVSIFQLPLFIAANIYASITYHKLDGYSTPYQIGVLLSSILFVFLGLLVLRKFLLQYGFKDIPIAITLLILAFGTNLYSYAAYQPGMGHPYSFFLYAYILFLTQQLFLTYRKKHFVLLGLCIGLAILIRPVDIFVVLIPLLWTGKNFTITYKRIFTEHTLSVVLATMALIVVWLPQLVYWKTITGSFFYYSYGQEGFDFTNPHILKGLFSYQKGWFIYTPLALVGFISLIVSLISKKYKSYAISALVFYAVSFFVIFSWHQWYYGGSFGARVLINSLPLLAIPFCSLIEKIARSKLIIKLACLIVLVGLVKLNLFQCWQYDRSIIHWDQMNKEYYWRVFMKEEVSDSDRELLY